VRTERLFAATGVRLSFIYSGLLIASFSLAIALTWIAARSAAESDLRDRISLEVEALRSEIRDEGIDAAVAAIAVRAERPGALEYWLVNPAGRVLSGDLPLLTTTDGWHRVQLPDAATAAEHHEDLLVLTATMRDGARLSVGDDLRGAESVRDAVLQSLLWIGLATVVLGIATGIFVTRRSLGQMDALTAIVGEVAAGKLDARLSLRAAAKPNDLDRLGESVNRMLDHIDRLVRNLRRVSSDVAHDLRTPLSHVQQRLELARNAANANDRLAAIEAAESKITEVLQAFDAILRLAEIEAGAAQSRFVELDVAALIERVADAYRPDVEASGRLLEVSQNVSASIRGDADLLAQALANLIENAIRHTPEGTHITLATRSDGLSLHLTVADNGPGIPQDRHADVLQAYRRLDNSRSTAGFGLGLSIVAAVARLHNARLELSDARPGLRATMVFSTPEQAAAGGAAQRDLSIRAL
jgi:signal transduction histidine kinase